MRRAESTPEQIAAAREFAANYHARTFADLPAWVREDIEKHTARDVLEELRIQAHIAAKIAKERSRPPEPVKNRIGWNLEAYGEKFGWVAESDEDSPSTSIHHAAAARFHAQQLEAERDFLADAEENTGVEMSVEEYSKRANLKERLREMTREIARKLELAGVKSIRDDGYKLWAYSIHSETLEEIELYRRICVLPTVAAATRAKILAAIEFFVQENRFLRFWTLTTGDRCFVEEIPGRLDWAFERMRKLNYELRKRWGVSILLRSTEFGTVENAQQSGGLLQFDRDGQGRLEPTYHPHLHLIVSCERGFIAPDIWEALCEFVRRFWGYHCDFTGGKKGAIITSAREFVKYVTKPGEMVKLTPEQLRKFYEATANRRLLRPMGRLAAQIAARRDPNAPKTLRRKRTANGWKWFEVWDHNKTSFNRYSEEEKAARAIIDAEADKDEAIRFAAECEAAAEALAGRIAPPSIDRGGSYDTAGNYIPNCRGADIPAVYSNELPPVVSPARDGTAVDFCRVVARIAPAATGSRLKEPRVVVMGTRFDVGAVKRHELVQQLWARTVEAWEAGEMLAHVAAQSPGQIYVHTGTLSVRPPDRPPPPKVRPDPVQLVFATA